MYPDSLSDRAHAPERRCPTAHSRRSDYGGRMKTILKATLAGAIAAGVFSALLSRLVAQQAEAFRRERIADRVPSVNPVADAEPYIEGALQESDLRVAQNSPL
jgi:hypothetical protein